MGLPGEKIGLDIPVGVHEVSVVVTQLIAVFDDTADLNVGHREDL